jgi:GT2 family glycosyltransferase
MNTDKNENFERPDLIESLKWPEVLAVIVNWNGKEDVLECLESLLKVNYPKDKFRIVVVDNGSSDGSPADISRAYPDVFLIKNKKNRGYVRAVNQGIDQGLTRDVEYVWVCNNDIVVDEDALVQLVAIGQSDPQIGVVGPVIYSYRNPRTIDNVGYKINFWVGRLKKLKYEDDIFSDPRSRMCDVDSNLGCSNIIKTSLIQSIGVFRPIYKIYFEETDFNARARRAGSRVVVARKAKVWHKRAATMDRFLFRRAYLLLRNLFIFEILNARLKHLIVFIPYYFLFHVPYFLIHGSYYGLRVKLRNKKALKWQASDKR